MAMCGRFVLRASPEQMAELFELEEPTLLAPRFNIAPTQPLLIVRNDPATQQRAWAHVLWGLIPSWAKDPSIGQKMINARAETIAEKPSFRAAFKRRRCLVPASGFYEWKRTPAGKEAHYITVDHERPFAIAGLWESWQGGGGGELQTCTLLTTDANDAVAPLHDRMPVIIEPEDYSLWLGSGKDDPPGYLDQLRHLLRSFPSDRTQVRRVSSFVNNVRNDGEQCIEPAPSA